ncbi:hypothetical protein [Lacticaseibacillus yichunensis]|uniref:Lipoprotein n=1 Tax=Lacticaseibacillus yichunensis TaxID=2486015 RepID=A0ABW4CN04_9LACO|nr:hypothetical protein [Lacticaseibacillus yichunensis]
MRIRKLIGGLVVVGVLATLSGCGQASPPVVSYRDHGKVAVISGSAHQKVTVTAQTKSGTTASKGTAHPNQGRYQFYLPVTTQTQIVRVKTAGKTNTIHVKATRALIDAKDFTTKYDQALAVSQLTPAQQKAVLTPQPSQKALAKLSPAQQQALAQQVQALRRAYAKADAATQAQRIPALRAGTQTIFAKDGITISANVRDNQLMTLTASLTPALLKTKKSLTTLGTQLGLMASALGADPQTVTMDLQKALAGSLSQATHQVITSNGVHIQLGITLSHVYVYLYR